MRALSHVAIGVSDMERSLPFYRDLLGLRVTLDTAQNIGGFAALFHNADKGQRRAVRHPGLWRGTRRHGAHLSVSGPRWHHPAIRRKPRLRTARVHFVGGL